MEIHHYASHRKRQLNLCLYARKNYGTVEFQLYFLRLCKPSINQCVFHGFHTLQNTLANEHAAFRSTVGRTGPNERALKTEFNLDRTREAPKFAPFLRFPVYA